MIRIHGSIQIPTTQVSQIKGLAVGLVRRYPLPLRPCKGGRIEQFLKIKESHSCVGIYILSTEDWSAQLPTAGR